MEHQETIKTEGKDNYHDPNSYRKKLQASPPLWPERRLGRTFPKAPAPHPGQIG